MSLEQGFASMVRPWAPAAGVWRPKNAAIRNRTMAPYMAVSVTSTGIPASVSLTRPRERVYRGGRCGHWIKVKNRQHPAA
jgi:hypothetical protein